MSKFTKGPWNKGKGKGWIDARGYRQIKINGKQMREHRYIMQIHLGRELEPWEHVHHKDGNKLNNNLSNLEVLSWDKHAKEHIGHVRSDQSKITMAIQRSMKMEILKLRKINREMYEALKLVSEHYCFHKCNDEPYLKAITDALKKAIGES